MGDPDDGFTADQFVKLGTSLRYLMEVAPGELLGDRRVVPNIVAVTTLCQSLGFDAARTSGPYTRFVRLGHALQLARNTRHRLTDDEAEELNTASRKLRTEILAEGKHLRLHAAQDELPAPDVVSFPWLWQHMSVRGWLLVVSLFFSALGIGFGVATWCYDNGWLKPPAVDASTEPPKTPPGG